MLATALAIQTNNFTYVDAVDGGWMPQFLADLQAARDRGANWEELDEIRGSSPPLGQDTDAILTRLGYTAEQIEDLRSKGVTR